MNRREFSLAGLSIATLATLGGCASMSTGESKAETETKAQERKLGEIGIQLWTVREMFKTDPVGTFQMLAKVGYQQVEFANLEPLPRTPKELRKIADDVGISFPAAHFNPNFHFEQPQFVIDTAGELGCKYVINSWVDEKDRTKAGYQKQADMFNKVGEKMRGAGLQYGFHNHEFEFQKMDGEKTGYDILIQNTDPALVFMELDMYWVVDGGANILDLLNRYSGRFKTCHIKDRTADGKMVNVGEGVIDWKTSIARAADQGMEYYFAEHDSLPAPYEASVATSYNYMRALRF
jgi:sugar phosphate isomerase/epimerase